MKLIKKYRGFEICQQTSRSSFLIKNEKHWDFLQVPLSTIEMAEQLIDYIYDMRKIMKQK